MFGEYESVEQFKEAVKGQIEARQNNEYDQGYFEGLLEEIASQATVKFPPQVLEHEMEHVVENVTHDLSHQHMDLDTYLKTIKKEKDEWMENEVKTAAAKNLTKSLVMQELSRVEAIKLANEDLQAEATNMLAEMQQNTDPKALEKQLKNKEFVNMITMEAASRVMNRKVFERVKEIATGKMIEAAANESKTEPTKVEKPKTSRKSTKIAATDVEEVKETKPAAKKRVVKTETAKE